MVLYLSYWPFSPSNFRITKLSCAREKLHGFRDFQMLYQQMLLAMAALSIQMKQKPRLTFDVHGCTHLRYVILELFHLVISCGYGISNQWSLKVSVIPVKYCMIATSVNHMF